MAGKKRKATVVIESLVGSDEYVRDAIIPALSSVSVASKCNFLITPFGMIRCESPGQFKTKDGWRCQHHAGMPVSVPEVSDIRDRAQAAKDAIAALVEAAEGGHRDVARYLARMPKPAPKKPSVATRAWSAVKALDWHGVFLGVAYVVATAAAPVVAWIESL